MQTIEIDFDVFKALTALRASERDTYNDVLRDILKLPKHKPPLSPQELDRMIAKGNVWQTGGVNFPQGTEFRAIYKGKTHTATIKDGALLVNGRRAVNPSSAAHLITGNNVNGWRFWEARLPGHTDWRKLETFCSRISRVRSPSLDIL